MSGSILSSPELLAELRRSFDQSFTVPPPPGKTRHAMIAMRLAGEPMALRADQITGIFRCRRIVPVPGRVRELIGITGMRGVLVPVFDLAALLGLAPATKEPSWVAMAHRESPIALAFDAFEGQVEIEPECLYDGENAPLRRHARQLARIESTVRAVIDVAAVVDSIRIAAGPQGVDR